jgi:hypothetical protein
MVDMGNAVAAPGALARGAAALPDGVGGAMVNGHNTEYIMRWRLLRHPVVSRRSRIFNFEI